MSFALDVTHLAALLVQRGVTVLYTPDADLRRFQDRQVLVPFGRR